MIRMIQLYAVTALSVLAVAGCNTTGNNASNKHSVTSWSSRMDMRPAVIQACSDKKGYTPAYCNSIFNRDRGENDVYTISQISAIYKRAAAIDPDDKNLQELSDEFYNKAANLRADMERKKRENDEEISKMREEQAKISEKKRIEEEENSLNNLIFKCIKQSPYGMDCQHLTDQCIDSAIYRRVSRGSSLFHEQMSLALALDVEKLYIATHERGCKAHVETREERDARIRQEKDSAYNSCMRENSSFLGSPWKCTR